MSSLYSFLLSAAANASALRLIVKLKPANADGIIYPPTYEGGKHIFRPAWIDGKERQAVLLDSTQSQANRIESAILDAHRRRRITYPDIELVVNASTGKETYSVLELSHRVYDSALRMSTIDNIPFAQSGVGKAIYSARAVRATGLYTHAPITLILGGWDSHGGGGPMVAKLPRLITSEIIGLDAKPVARGAGKIDPMDIRKDAGPVYRSGEREGLWETDKEKSADKKGLDPSNAGLGNIPPSITERGAVITEAVQTSVISCAAVRRLRFELENESYKKDERDRSGQAVIITLGLFGLFAQMESGYCLRSGCDLFPIHEPKLEVIGSTLEKTEVIPVTTQDALEALNESLRDAKSQGLAWREEPISVMADQTLVTLVERSRKATEMES